MPHRRRSTSLEEGAKSSDGKLRVSRKAVPAGPEAIIDLKSPDLYRHDRHFAAFGRLRRETPVYWNPESDATGFWAVTRYKDVLAVLQDAETFSPAPEHGGIRIFDIQNASEEPLAPHIFSMVPPAHMRMRKSLAPAVASDRVAEIERFARCKVRSLLNGIVMRGHADFATEVAAPLAISVLARLLNVPEEDGPRLRRWSETLIGDDDSDYQSSETERETCVVELDDYATSLLADRLRKPGNDLASCLAKAVAKDELAEARFRNNFAVLLVAGNETTRHAISNAILAFTRFPEARSKLLSDMTLLGSAVEEVVRWASPLLHIRRTATRDVTLGGVRIRAGDKVVVWYVSANRDGDLWERSDDFDIERFAGDDAVGHLGFGAGSHHCLGWRIAEMEIRVALEETFSALPDIMVAGPVDRLRSNLIYGIKRLPVAFSPKRISL